MGFPWPPSTLLGFAVIDSDGTVLRSGGLVTGVVHGSTGSYILSMVSRAAGAADDDPNVAVNIETRDAAVHSAEWQNNAWNVTIITHAGADLDSRFSIAFYKG